MEHDAFKSFSRLGILDTRGLLELVHLDVYQHLIGPWRKELGACWNLDGRPLQLMWFVLQEEGLRWQSDHWLSIVRLLVAPRPHWDYLLWRSNGQSDWIFY